MFVYQIYQLPFKGYERFFSGRELSDSYIIRNLNVNGFSNALGMCVGLGGLRKLREAKLPAEADDDAADIRGRK